MDELIKFFVGLDVHDLSGGCGAPDRIRTCYRRLRSQIDSKFNVYYQLFV